MNASKNFSGRAGFSRVRRQVENDLVLTDRLQIDVYGYDKDLSLKFIEPEGLPGDFVKFTIDEYIGTDLETKIETKINKEDCFELGMFFLSIARNYTPLQPSEKRTSISEKENEDLINAANFKPN